MDNLKSGFIYWSIAKKNGLLLKILFKPTKQLGCNDFNSLFWGLKVYKHPEDFPVSDNTFPCLRFHCG